MATLGNNYVRVLALYTTNNGATSTSLVLLARIKPGATNGY